MKRFSKVLAVMLTFMMVFSIMSIPSSAAPTTLPWKGISNKIAVGQTVDPSIYFDVTPQKAKKLKFTSKTPSIIKVQNNKIKGLKVGTGTFVNTDTETGKTVTHTIKVVKELTWKKISNKINIGETVDPVKYFTVDPASRASKLVFTMKDPNNGIAKVVNNKIVGVSAGSTRFITRDPETGASEEHTIIVRTKLTWKKISNKIKVGETVDPVQYFDVEPKSKEKDLVFTMKDPSNGIAKVVNNQIVGISAGSTRFITTDPETGASAEHTIIVVPTTTTPETILANSISDLHKGDTVKINATVTPSGASDELAYEVVSGSKYASVDGNGNVTGKARGEATIKITSVKDPSVSKTITVTVKEYLTRVTEWKKYGDTMEVVFGNFQWTPGNTQEFNDKMQNLIGEISKKLGNNATYEMVRNGVTYTIEIGSTGMTIKDQNGQIQPTDKFLNNGQASAADVKIILPQKWIDTLLKYMEEGNTDQILQFNGVAMSAVNFIGFSFEFGSLNKVKIVYTPTGETTSYEYFVSNGVLYFRGDVTKTPIMTERLANPNSDKCIFSKLDVDWY